MSAPAPAPSLPPPYAGRICNGCGRPSATLYCPVCQTNRWAFER